ncbi:hypothetical protein H6P81_002880 [Aristolochia fimbriata]|uniref:Uncharacterized protein n=1 Tax=Aristolochia fimbriata TaxID=158543 RepID=A0AAV7FF48_ARIFI|nr:hypothetical protein H6P81_002880 [Aristolochia fimbriata]
MDHISIWMTFSCNGQLVYTPIFDDISLEGGLGMVKHGFQTTLVLFCMRDCHRYEMDSRRSLSNEVGTREGAPVDTGEGAPVETIDGAPVETGKGAPAEMDERDPIEIDERSPIQIGEGTITGFIPEGRKSREDPNSISSGEDEWSDPVRDENDAEEKVETPVPNMGVSSVEDELDESYPDMWIGEIETDARYMTILIPSVNEVYVSPPVGVEVGRRRGGVQDLEKIVWECASAQTMEEYNVAIQNLEEVCPEAKEELTEGIRHEQWALAHDGNVSFGKHTTNSSESMNALLKRAWSLPVMMAVTLLYDQASHRSKDPGCLECTEHFQTLRHWPMDERLLSYIKAACFGVLVSRGRLSLAWIRERFAFCPDDMPNEVILRHARAYLLLVGSTIFSDGSARGFTWRALDTIQDFETARELWVWERLHIGHPTLLEEQALQDDPLSSRWNDRRINAINCCGNLVLYRTELNHQRSYQVTPQKDVELVTRIYQKG